MNASLTSGTKVRTAKGITGTTTGTPVLTPSGHVVSVAYDAEFAHLSPTGGADYNVDELTALPAANVIRVAVRAFRKGGGSMVGLAATIHQNCDCRVASTLTGTFDNPADAEAHATAKLQEQGRSYSYCKNSRPLVAEAPAAPAAKTTREALGAASAAGWELLYDKPKQNCEVGRRYDENGKAHYALICKTTGKVHELDRLSDERAVRKANNWR